MFKSIDKNSVIYLHERVALRGKILRIGLNKETITSSNDTSLFHPMTVTFSRGNAELLYQEVEVLAPNQEAALVVLKEGADREGLAVTNYRFL